MSWYQWIDRAESAVWLRHSWLNNEDMQYCLFSQGGYL